jgi:hypothetical protein
MVKIKRYFLLSLERKCFPELQSCIRTNENKNNSEYTLKKAGTL